MVQKMGLRTRIVCVELAEYSRQPRGYRYHSGVMIASIRQTKRPWKTVGVEPASPCPGLEEFRHPARSCRYLRSHNLRPRHQPTAAGIRHPGVAMASSSTGASATTSARWRSRELGRKLGATVISSRYSRLLIDPIAARTIQRSWCSFQTAPIVPGNTRLDEAERAQRIAATHAPYHRVIESGARRHSRRGLVPAFVPIHSFTDTWRGVPRKWHAAILWDRDRGLRCP